MGFNSGFKGLNSTQVPFKDLFPLPQLRLNLKNSAFCPQGVFLCFVLSEDY